MKVAIIADSHYDQHSRFDECCRVHAWIAEDARARGVDLVLHTGDVYERKSTPLERAAAAGWFQLMAAIAPTVIVRGNHDAVDDLPLLERLEAVHPIKVVQAAEVVHVAGAAVACLAWPQKATLLAATGAEGGEAGSALAADALRNVLRGLALELEEHDGPRIFMAHAMVRGSRTSSGQPLVGCDLELGLEDLALVRAALYALGHIHLGQEWDIAGAPCVYPGSPRRSNFGELEEKCYLVAKFRGAKLVGVERIKTPCTPMYHVDDEWSAGQGWLAGAHGLPETCAGAELRFRYRVASDQRDGARAAAEERRADWLNEGALHVKLEEVVAPTTRARTPEVAAAPTLAGKLEAFWTATRFEPGDRRDALLSKAVQLEEVTRAA